jgi:monoamine oxidase
MGILRASFGPIVDEQFESMESFSWNKDRFSQGAYCFNPMGSSLDDVETTKIPLNDKLYFAGDFACGEFLGSVHGASLCGEMHANHILKSPRSSGSKE